MQIEQNRKSISDNIIFLTGNYLNHMDNFSFFIQ